LARHWEWEGELFASLKCSGIRGQVRNTEIQTQVSNPSARPKSLKIRSTLPQFEFFFQAECASLISQVDVWMFFGHLGGPHQGHLLMEPGLLFLKEFEVVKGKQDNERCFIHFCSYHLFVSHCFSMFYSSGSYINV